jgi:lysophospholipase L1-like esterase
MYYPWLAYEYKKKKKSKLSRFILIFSFALIAMGVSLVLCADMLGTPETATLARDESQTPEPGPASLPAEEAEAPQASDELPAPVSEAAPGPVPGPAFPPAEADEALPEPASEESAVAAAAEAGAPPPGDELVSAVVSASSAEETPQKTFEGAPPPGAVDLSEIDDYFSDALFIGDSRTQGLLLYSNLGNAVYYAARGLTVEQVFKKAFVDVDGGKLTVSDALDRRAFGKVYLMFGLNELGWNVEKFIEQYGRVLDRVRETQPDAVIYVQGVMPVSARKSAKDPVHNNPNIERFNAMIVKLAEEKNAIYLNVGEGVADENGVLPSEASSDGIHLNKKYCIKWEAYLRAHQV